MLPINVKNLIYCFNDVFLFSGHFIIYSLFFKLSYAYLTSLPISLGRYFNVLNPIPSTLNSFSVLTCLTKAWQPHQAQIVSGTERKDCNTCSWGTPLVLCNQTFGSYIPPKWMLRGKLHCPCIVEEEWNSTIYSICKFRDIFHLQKVKMNTQIAVFFLLSPANANSQND